MNPITEHDCARESSYSGRFEISAPLATPSGRRILFRSIWQIDTGTDFPRLITLYPR